MSAADAVTLTPGDLIVLRTTYHANVNYPGMPFLCAAKWQKKAKALAALGYLKNSNTKIFPNPEGWDAYFITTAGCDAYNKAMEKK